MVEIIRTNKVPDFNLHKGILDANQNICEIRFSMLTDWYINAKSLSDKLKTSFAEVTRQHLLNNMDFDTIRKCCEQNKDDNSGTGAIEVKDDVTSTLTKISLPEAVEFTNICEQLGITRRYAASCLFSYVPIPEDIQVNRKSYNFIDIDINISEKLQELLNETAGKMNISVERLISDIVFDRIEPSASERVDYMLSNNEKYNYHLQLNKKLYKGNFTYSKEMKYKIIQFFSSSDFKFYTTKVYIPSSWKEFIIKNNDAFCKHIQASFCNDSIGEYKNVKTILNFPKDETEEFVFGIILPKKEYKRTLLQTNKTFSEFIIHVIYQFMGNEEVDGSSFNKVIK